MKIQEGSILNYKKNPTYEHSIHSPPLISMSLRASFRKWPYEGVSLAIILMITFKVITVVLTITFNDC